MNENEEVVVNRKDVSKNPEEIYKDKKEEWSQGQQIQYGRGSSSKKEN